LLCRLPPGVDQLKSDLAALLVNGIHYLLEPGDQFVAVNSGFLLGGSANRVNASVSRSNRATRQVVVYCGQPPALFTSGWSTRTCSVG
jgi:hypothetical protein